jgi:MFS family permease
LKHYIRKNDENSEFYRWVIATGGFLAQFIGISGKNLFPVLLVFIEEALRISHAESGIIFAASSALWAAGALIWGKMADVVKTRILLLAACIILSIGTVQMGSINSFIEGVVAYSFIGFGSAAPIILVTKLISMKYYRGKRATALSYVNSSTAISGMLMGALAPFLATSYGWRFPFHLLGAVFLCLSLMVYFLVKDPSKKNNWIEKTKPNYTQAKELRRKEYPVKMKMIFKMILLHFFSAMTLSFISNFLVAYLIESGVEKLTAGYAYSIYAVSNLLGMFFWGNLSDRKSRKTVLFLSGFLQIIFISLILIYKQDPTIYAEIIFLGFSTGTVPTIFAITAEYFSPKNLGALTGISVSFAGIAGIISPLLVGTLATLTGTLAVSLQLAGLTAVVTIISVASI